MRRKGAQEISVYSTSAIDLFCSAMGVFMVICFIALAQQQPVAAPTPPAPVPPAPAPPPQSKKKGLSKPIMIAQCEWNTRADIDMAVRFCPPNGTAIWFCFDLDRGQQRRTHDGFYGGLLHDALSTDAPRDKTEQWALLATHEGTYEVYLVLFDSSTAQTTDTTVHLMTEDNEETCSVRLSHPSKVLAQAGTAIERQYLNRISAGEMLAAGSFVVTRQDSSFKIQIKPTER